MNFRHIDCIPTCYSKQETPMELREYVFKESPKGPVGTMKEISTFVDKKIGEPCALHFHTLEGKELLNVTKCKAGKVLK